jgi:uncharacterized protein YbjT (DUF2867 family)
MNGPVLVIGATGHLGRQVAAALLERGKHARAFVRPETDATVLPAGVDVKRGDMLDPASLRAAMDGADAVVTSAAGYTRRRKADTSEADTTGNRNIGDAVLATGVRRLVFTGILRSDEAPDVPHFWHKVLAERFYTDAGVPYVSLRPGAFFDQVAEMMPGGGPRSGRLISPMAPDVPQTFVLTADVAAALAALVDAPVRDGEHVDLGWDRPVNMRDAARLSGAALGRRVRLITIPWPLLNGGLALAGRFSEQFADLRAMLRFFATGAYVADTTRQKELFGAVPTAEDAMHRWAASPPPQR